MLKDVVNVAPVEQIALHCHDTRKRALENIRAGLALGVTVIDSSVGGLGGCPYATGASGNVATESVLEMLHELDIETGVSIEKIRDTAQFIRNHLAHT